MLRRRILDECYKGPMQDGDDDDDDNDVDDGDDDEKKI